MVSFCEDSLIGGSNINVKKGVPFGTFARLVPHVDKAPLPLRILRLVTSNFLPVENPTLSFFLSIFTGSLIYEHYTRECEFGNFDKIKNTKHKKNKTTQKKHKNFWLNFCLNKECPKLLCGLGICHRRRQTIPMWNSTGEKRILQGITVCLVSAVLSTM